MSINKEELIEALKGLELSVEIEDSRYGMSGNVKIILSFEGEHITECALDDHDLESIKGSKYQ